MPAPRVRGGLAPSWHNITLHYITLHNIVIDGPGRASSASSRVGRRSAQRSHRLRERLCTARPVGGRRQLLVLGAAGGALQRPRQTASQRLRRRSGVRSSGPGLGRPQAGGWGAALTQGTRHLPPVPTSSHQLRGRRAPRAHTPRPLAAPARARARGRRRGTRASLSSARSLVGAAACAARSATSPCRSGGARAVSLAPPLPAPLAAVTAGCCSTQAVSSGRPAGWPLRS